MRRHGSSAVLLVTIAWAVAAPRQTDAAPGVEQRLAEVFAELQAVEPMQPGKRYTVRVGEQQETGRKERFLRRRTADEIRSSRLSSGCGDYAILFTERAEAAGFETLFIDAAEISIANLNHRFSGHAVVAVREDNASADAPWRLVDPTRRTVLSKNWSPSEQSFAASGGVYWIGYRGPLPDYPVEDGRELSDFYAKTLERIPKHVLNRTLYKLDFRVDPSLIDREGECLNPRLSRFIQEQSHAFERYGIAPEREVLVTLKRGGDDHLSRMTHSETQGWVSTVGLRSGCSPSMLAGLERQIRRRDTRTHQPEP